jgi:predicted amidohydrolase YtcJ
MTTHSEPAEMILHNGLFTTLDREQPEAQAVAIRGGLNYNMELRWDGVPSLADALRRLREQAIGCACWAY